MDYVDELWWRNGIFYQIYPRSFQDSDADGVGDLKGIIGRLPYLQTLGIDAVWLSPIFASPMADFGYDISDYTGIDPLFGTMEDFDALVAAAHDAGLKVILDLVPNHTSDQHPSKAAAHAITQNATGTSGVTRRRMAARRTTGCRNLAAVRGPTMRRLGNITITPSSPSSRT
jgi:alpha-glucosidase